MRPLPIAPSVLALDGAGQLSECEAAVESRRLIALNALENIRPGPEGAIGAAQLAGRGVAAQVGLKEPRTNTRSAGQTGK